MDKHGPFEYHARAVAYLITEADVAYLLRSKKFIHRVIRNSADSGQEVLEIVVIYNVRRKDREHLELKLRFSARLERAVKVTVPQPRPGVSLTWHGNVSEEYHVESNTLLFATA